MYKIGDLSRCTGLTVKTLRYWADIGLLVPDETDRFTGYRYYSASKLRDCIRIIALKELGFSLDEIRAFADSDKTRLVESKTAELERSVRESEAKLRRLRELRSELEEGKNMYDIVIKPAEGFRAVTDRRIFADRKEALAALAALRERIPKRALGARLVIISYETEYRETDLDLEIGVEVDRSVSGKNISFSFGTDIETATLVTTEPELDSAYRELNRRLAADDCQIVGAYYEILHEDGVIELKVPVCRLTDDRVFSGEEKLPFVNDPDAVGRWKLLDVVPTEAHFVYSHPKATYSPWLEELYFLSGGGEYWGVAGWTKGVLYNYSPAGILSNPYRIERRGEHKLMFIAMKSCIRNDGKLAGVPNIWVLEQTDDKERSRENIRLTDRVDYPFVPDERVLGVWRVRDFVRERADFDPDKQNSTELFMQKLEFCSDSRCIYTSKNNSHARRWTKGLTLSDASRTACAYELVTLGGREYLFVEWKSGDYSFGGGRVYWYIFER